MANSPKSKDPTKKTLRMVYMRSWNHHIFDIFSLKNDWNGYFIVKIISNSFFVDQLIFAAVIHSKGNEYLTRTILPDKVAIPKTLRSTCWDKFKCSMEGESTHQSWPVEAQISVLSA